MTARLVHERALTARVAELVKASRGDVKRAILEGVSELKKRELVTEPENASLRETIESVLSALAGKGDPQQALETSRKRMWAMLTSGAPISPAAAVTHGAAIDLLADCLDQRPPGEVVFKTAQEHGAMIALGGAFIGATIGSEIGGPLGGAIGGTIGLIVGAAVATCLGADDGGGSGGSGGGSGGGGNSPA